MEHDMSKEFTRGILFSGQQVLSDSRRGGGDEAEGPLVDVVRLGVGDVLDLGPVHLGQAAQEVEGRRFLARAAVGVDFVGLGPGVILLPLLILLLLLLPPPPLALRAPRL